MFDLLLGLRQAVEGRAKSKRRSWDLNPFLGIFGFWAYVMGMGMSAHGFTHA
jgi:hypothetical protein